MPLHVAQALSPTLSRQREREPHLGSWEQFGRTTNDWVLSRGTGEGAKFRCSMSNSHFTIMPHAYPT
jgi:hypothetical protein